MVEICRWGDSESDLSAIKCNKTHARSSLDYRQCLIVKAWQVRYGGYQSYMYKKTDFTHVFK